MDSMTLRRRVIAVRVDADEHAAIVAAVARSGRRQVGAWGRGVLLRAARVDTTTVPATPSAEVEALRAATAELVAIGRNLNQCTRALNTPGGDEGRRFLRWLSSHIDAVDERTEAVRAAAEAVRNRTAR